jgi:hypothetical protein
MRAIGRFLKHHFLLTPLEFFIGVGLMVLCGWIMVGPFFGFGVEVKKKLPPKRGSEKKTSTL